MSVTKEASLLADIDQTGIIGENAWPKLRDEG